MECPEQSIFRSRLLCVSACLDRDYGSQPTPTIQLVNPLRYELTFFPKSYNNNAPMFIVNKRGKAFSAIRDLIYIIKLKLKPRQK